VHLIKTITTNELHIYGNLNTLNFRAKIVVILRLNLGMQPQPIQCHILQEIRRLLIGRIFFFKPRSIYYSVFACIIFKELVFEMCTRSQELIPILSPFSIITILIF